MWPNKLPATYVKQFTALAPVLSNSGAALERYRADCQWVEILSFGKVIWAVIPMKAMLRVDAGSRIGVEIHDITDSAAVVGNWWVYRTGRNLANDYRMGGAVKRGKFWLVVEKIKLITKEEIVE